MDIFNLVRKNDTKKDWSYNKSDEELKLYIKEFYHKNLYLIEECKKYNFKYVDTHNNREEVLNQVFESICSELSD